MSWNNTEPKSTRANPEKLAKVKKNKIMFCASVFSFSPSKLKWPAILQVWALSEHCRKITKVFSGSVSENPKNPFFKYFWRETHFAPL